MAATTLLSDNGVSSGITGYQLTGGDDGTLELQTTTAGGNAVKAWVNFNGTGTVAIRASYNVSSITDNGTGLYTVNFTTAMSDVNYASAYGADNSGGVYFNYSPTTTQTTTALQTRYVNIINASVDGSWLSVSIFR